jgi:hypothetical protein
VVDDEGAAVGLDCGLFHYVCLFVGFTDVGVMGEIKQHSEGRNGECGAANVALHVVGRGCGARLTCYRKCHNQSFAREALDQT